MRWSYAFIAALWLLAVPATASASTKAERDAERKALDARLDDELRAIAPDAVQPFDAANAAYFSEKESELEAADKGYARVLELAPEFAPALRRRAGVLAQRGHRTDALVLARKAFAIKDSVENASSLAQVLVARIGGVAPLPADVREARHIIDGALVGAPLDLHANIVDCQIALEEQDGIQLADCSKRVIEIAPDEPAGHSFAAIAAGVKGDKAAALDAIAKGRAAGMDPQTAAGLEKLADANESTWSKWIAPGLKVLAVWLAGLVLLLGIGAALSRATLRLAGTLQHEDGRARAATLRGVYRFVLHLTCLYYYLSIPVVLAFCAAAGAGVIVGFFMLGTIPVKLVLIIVVVVAYTVWAVVKSIFFRPREEEPGTRLSLRDHPKLRAALDEVAKRVDTRPVDNVYVTPNVSVAVLERGGLAKQLTGKTERCLVLGVATLDGMKLAPFKAILAHEYGHFSNRDTAGGGFAIAVRRSLILTMIGLASGGAATWYNPAWWFVVGFQRLFLRVSQGASRLQEILADRWAAVSYGAEAFSRGLSHVVRRTIEFDAHTQLTLQEVIKLDRGLKNLYVYTPRKKIEEDKLEDAFEEAMNGDPSPYDSHPRPADRIAWVRELASSVKPHEDDDRDAWDLFDDKEALQRAMTDEIRAAVERNHGVVIAKKSKKKRAEDEAPDEESPPAP